VGAIVAGLVVVGVGGYFGYRMLFANDSAGRIATSESTPATAPVPAPEPPKDTSEAPQPPAPDSASTQSPPAAMPPDAEAKPAGMDASTAGSKSDATKAAGMASATKDLSKAPPPKAGTPPGLPGSAPSTTDAPKAVAQAGTPPQQIAQTDRWKLMKDAMAKCVGETFFKRVACEQSVGLQYCEGYWGKVPQCPSGPSKDRGQ
jgi:hypothetical protein